MTPTPGHPPGSPRSTAAAQALEKVRGIGGPLDETTGRECLAALLEGVQLKYGALFTYNGESHTLTLLAQQGLSSQAIDAVKTIRRGVGGVWDMPLHAVMQRRVYIIEKPRENPFVPVL